jgi:hypothetical protein
MLDSRDAPIILQRSRDYLQTESNLRVARVLLDSNPLSTIRGILCGTASVLIAFPCPHLEWEQQFTTRSERESAVHFSSEYLKLISI